LIIDQINEKEKKRKRKRKKQSEMINLKKNEKTKLFNEFLKSK